MQWPCLNLHIKTELLNLLYKLVQYKCNIYVHNTTVFKCTKNHANRFRRLKM